MTCVAVLRRHDFGKAGALIKAAATAIFFLCISFAAAESHATLVLRDNDTTVFDDQTNLIWLRSWSLRGGDTWWAQMGWALNLEYAGSTDWRLPTLGELTGIYVYGLPTHNPNFVDVVGSAGYWSSTENCGGCNAAFSVVASNTLGAVVGNNVKADMNYAVAVRVATDEDLAAMQVPEPGSAALVLMGIGVAGLIGRRRGALQPTRANVNPPSTHSSR